MAKKNKPTINQQLFDQMAEYENKNEAYNYLTDVWERVGLGFIITDEGGKEFEADTFLELIAANLEVQMRDHRRKILDILR